ncbi:hypothetical protein [Agrobacterium sp. P15N1-A]|uniref:hypothetical protein n=1 Tax=Agrobacterium sp. P15N1-A TaxID=3342820 RepID=UPI0037CEC31C
MTHSHKTTMPLGNITAEHREAVRKWSNKHHNLSYPDDQVTLHHCVALFYADPRRPSIRQLHAALCEMLDRDSVLSGACPVHPTLPEFRKLVLTLPATFVDHMRYGRSWNIWDVLASSDEVGFASETTSHVN